MNFTVPQASLNTKMTFVFSDNTRFVLQVQELPDHNFETLKYLVNHLKMVSDNCDKNKVSVG